MKKKILVLGAAGMAGHMIHNYLDSTGKYEMYNTVYRNPFNHTSIFCNVKDTGSLEKLIIQINPDFVINSIGALIRESETNPANAIYLNSYLPHFLTEIVHKINAKLIHISTDCVFSGKKGNYKESDFRDADDIYGRSKALGEIINNADATLRTSIIGPEIKLNGKGLIHWFLSQKGSIKGYSKAIWSGVTSLELAMSVEKVIQNNLCGLFHVTNGIGISKYDLLTILKNYFNSSVDEIVPSYDFFTDKSLAVSDKYNFEVPAFEDMIKELFTFMKKYSHFYNHYGF